MRKTILITGIFLLGIAVLCALKIPGKGDSISDLPDNNSNHAYRAFIEMGLEGKLDYEIYSRALNGLQTLHFFNQKILTIIDYTKSSDQKRFYVLDLEHNRLMYESLVAHGKNSGLKFADAFSNQLHSLMSSPGFFKTGETYVGKNGYSLRLDGLEKGINDKARERDIVIHPANYVSEQFIHNQGWIGRSWGCPALPEDLSREVIDHIKEGSCVYIHTNNPGYLKETRL